MGPLKYLKSASASLFEMFVCKLSCVLTSSQIFPTMSKLREICHFVHFVILFGVARIDSMFIFFRNVPQCNDACPVSDDVMIFISA